MEDVRSWPHTRESGREAETKRPEPSAAMASRASRSTRARGPDEAPREKRQVFDRSITTHSWLSTTSRRARLYGSSSAGGAEGVRGECGGARWSLVARQHGASSVAARLAPPARGRSRLARLTMSIAVSLDQPDQHTCMHMLSLRRRHALD